MCKDGHLRGGVGTGICNTGTWRRSWCARGLQKRTEYARPGSRVIPEFQADGLRGMIVGLIKKPHVKEDITQLGDAVELSKRLGYKNSSALWYYKNYVPANWNNAEVMKSLLDGTMVENFIKMLNNVSKYAEGLNNL